MRSRISLRAARAGYEQHDEDDASRQRDPRTVRHRSRGVGVGHQPVAQRYTPSTQRWTEVAVDREVADEHRTVGEPRAHHPDPLQHERRHQRDDRSPDPHAEWCALRQRPQRHGNHERHARVARESAERGGDSRAQWTIGRFHHRGEREREAGEEERLAQHRQMHLEHRRHREERDGEEHAGDRRRRGAHEQHEGRDRHEGSERIYQPRGLRRHHAQAHGDRERGGIAGRKVGERGGAVRARPRRRGNPVLAVRHDRLRGTEIRERVRVEARSGRIGDGKDEREGGDAEQHRRCKARKELSFCRWTCHRGSGCGFGFRSVDNRVGWSTNGLTD